jgi:hypothetical protein
MRFYRKGKLVNISWHWSLFKQDIRTMWDSWFIRHIGLPLLSRRIVLPFVCRKAGNVEVKMSEHKYDGSKWTPPTWLLDVINSPNAEAVNGI